MRRRGRGRSGVAAEARTWLPGAEDRIHDVLVGDCLF
jgi:hypothetical protein